MPTALGFHRLFRFQNQPVKDYDELNEVPFPLAGYLHMSGCSRSHWKPGISSVALLALMAYLDHTTGYELVFSAAYLLPTLVCAWYFSRRVMLAMAFAGGVSTWFVDYYGGTPYSHFLFHYGNSITCFLVSGVSGLMFHKLRQSIAERDSTNECLRRALEQLEESTQEIRKLQEGLQVVCAWTKQIQVGDKWMTPDQFLVSQLHLKLSHGISPDGLRQFKGGNAQQTQRLDFESDQRSITR